MRQIHEKTLSAKNAETNGFTITSWDDRINTALHVRDEDFALDGGLSPNIPRSENYLNTGHPCRQDFEWFGKEIFLVESRIKKILDKYMSVPDATRQLVSQSQLTEKLKRSYIRIVTERVSRFARN